jgi:hypothetical protein
MTGSHRLGQTGCRTPRRNHLFVRLFAACRLSPTGPYWTSICSVTGSHGDLRPSWAAKGRS